LYGQHSEAGADQEDPQSAEDHPRRARRRRKVDPPTRGLCPATTGSNNLWWRGSVIFAIIST
jgi:hypothetical protein